MGENGATEKQQQMQQWSLVGFKAPYYHYVELPRKAKLTSRKKREEKKKRSRKLKKKGEKVERIQRNDKKKK